MGCRLGAERVLPCAAEFEPGNKYIAKQKRCVWRAGVTGSAALGACQFAALHVIQVRSRRPWRVATRARAPCPCSARDLTKSKSRGFPA